MVCHASVIVISLKESLRRTGSECCICGIANWPLTWNATLYGSKLVLKWYGTFPHVVCHNEQLPHGSRFLGRRDLQLWRLRVDWWLVPQATADCLESDCQQLSQAVEREASQLRLAAEEDALGSLNAMALVSLKAGQVELRDQILPDHSTAVLLCSQRITTLNSAIAAEGADLVSLLRAHSAQQQQMHATAWELQRQDLALQHKVAETRELQMLRLSGDVRVALAGGAAHAPQKSAADGDQKLLEHSKQQHVRGTMQREVIVLHCRQSCPNLCERSNLPQARPFWCIQGFKVRVRAGQYGKLTGNVADAIAANQELSMSIMDGQRDMKSREHLNQVAARREALGCKARDKTTSQVMLMSKLRAAALAQVQELAALNEQRAVWTMRSFPSFTHTQAGQPVASDMHR
jgi:hypothetical protein